MGLTKAAKERRRQSRRAEDAAAVCARKRPIWGKLAADTIAARHDGCDRCDEGFRLAGYRCPADPRHYHVGHSFWWSVQRVDW